MIGRLLKKFVPPLLVLGGVVVGLEFFIQAAAIPQWELPLPTAVFRSVVRDYSELIPALWTTTSAALIGFAASAVVGIAVAVVLSSSVWVRRAFYPYTIFFQTVPIVAIAPLLVLWCGPGLASVSLSAFIVSVFPVVANTLAGLLGTDPALLDLFRLYRAGPVDRLLKLRLPYALPSIVTGLRVAAGLAVIGTVVGEFVAGTLGDHEGLGIKIAGAKKNGHIDQVFAAVLLTSLLGLVMLAAVNGFGYLMLRRWHASEK